MGAMRETPDCRVSDRTDAASGRWTADHVAGCLVAAFETLGRMPAVRGPRQPGGHWPRHTVEWADQQAQAELPEPERRNRDALRHRVLMRPTGDEIARMDKALDWLRDLREADPSMALILSLWAIRAARGRSIRVLCRDRGWAPHTFYRVRSRALDHLAAMLNARATPVF